jgi:hypothetical protein
VEGGKVGATVKIDPTGKHYAYDAESTGGLTIRAEIAKALMAGYRANPCHHSIASAVIADWSLRDADALIAELNKGEK